jgi:hypothetical protein
VHSDEVSGYPAAVVSTGSHSAAGSHSAGAVGISCLAGTDYGSTG